MIVRIYRLLVVIALAFISFIGFMCYMCLTAASPAQIPVPDCKVVIVHDNGTTLTVDNGSISADSSSNSSPSEVLEKESVEPSDFGIIDRLQADMGVPSGMNVFSKKKLQLPDPCAIAILDGMGRYQEYYLKNIPDICVFSLENDNGLVLSISQNAGDDYYWLPTYGHVMVEEGDYTPIAIAYDFGSIIAENADGLYEISIITGENWTDATSTVTKIKNFDREDFVFLLTYVG